MARDDAQDAEILVPADLTAAALALLGPDESLNDFFLAALDNEVRRRRGLRTYDALLRVRERTARPASDGRQTPGLAGSPSPPRPFRMRPR